MSTFKKLRIAIRSQNDIDKLIALRDTGLDKLLAHPAIKDFTEEDKIKLIEIITKKIEKLGGE